MPEVTATCPHCSKRVKLKSESMLGKKIKCRSCEKPFVLKADAKKRSKPARKKQTVPADDDFGDDFYDSSQVRARRVRKKKGKSSSASKSSSDSEKKSTKEKPASIPLPLLIGGAVLGLCMMGGVGYFIFSKGSSLEAAAGGGGNAGVKVPDKFVKYEPEVGDFGCEYPEGWSKKGGGGQGGVQSWAKFLSPDENTSISIRGNMSGAALGGAGLAMNQGNEDDPEPPVVDIHLLMAKKFADDYANYEEIGDFTLFKSRLGDTCSSIFTTSSMFGGTQKGLRVTFLTGRVQFNLICLTSEGAFDKMLPVFDHVIETMREK